jgi:hypothetical protein
VPLAHDRAQAIASMVRAGAGRPRSGASSSDVDVSARRPAVESVGGGSSALVQPACTAVEQPRRRRRPSASQGPSAGSVGCEACMQFTCNRRPQPVGGHPQQVRAKPRTSWGRHARTCWGRWGRWGVRAPTCWGGPQRVGGRRRPESRPGTCKNWYYRPPSSISFNPTTVWATRAPETGVVQRWLPVLLI